jgi:hypothetical protein
MQVCLSKHNYKLGNNLLTVEPRAVDPHCFDADPEPDPDPAQNLDAEPDPDPDPGGGGGRSAINVHPPWQNPRYAPALEGSILIASTALHGFFFKPRKLLHFEFNAGPDPAFHSNADPNPEPAAKNNADPCGS